MRKLLILIPLLAVCISASAQEKRQKAIEITTGYPSLIFGSEYPWTQGVVDLSDKGQRVEEHFQPCLNIGYTFTKKKRWETTIILNLHLTVSDYMQYPKRPEEEVEIYHSRYYWDAEPVLDHRTTELWGALAIAFRYKWIAKENINLYSAIGAGISLGFPVPLPYLAPLGVKFGKGKVYGLAELNVSPISTFGMAGIGIRL